MKKISKKEFPDIMTRGLKNAVWQKFRRICGMDGNSANDGVKHLIYNAVKEYEAEHGEVIWNSKK